MAIEDDDIRDRETWTSVSRHWYSKASDKAPTTGRLYHHLAILARPNALQQLFYYAKSLCVAIPFLSARESIMTLFEPILGGVPGQQSRLQPIDAAYVRAHGILFSGKYDEKFEASVSDFLSLLDINIGRTTRRWAEPGYFIGISLCCAILEYGDESNPIVRSSKPARAADDADIHMEGVEPAAPSQRFKDALSMSMRTHEVVLRRFGDPSILAYFHTTMVFMLYCSSHPSIMVHFAAFPWKLASLMLNTLLSPSRATKRIQAETFPQPASNESPRPLPEEYALRGLLWVEDYFPPNWFGGDRIDDDEKYLELASMVEERIDRVLWIGHKIAAKGKWLTYDPQAVQFGVTEPFDIEIDTELFNTTMETDDAMTAEETESTTSTQRMEI